MLINNIDISTYSASLIERSISNHEIVTVEDWLEGSPSPIFHREYSRYKTVELTILIETTTDKLAEEQFEKLLNKLRLCTIKFEDMDKYFDCKFSGVAVPEKLYTGKLRVVITLDCYKTYKPETTVTVTNKLTATVNNAGSMATEVKIEITPTANIASFTITGLSKTPITIKNLTANKLHVIDGYKFMYLKDGASDIGNYDAFEFPTLQAGTNNISFSASVASLKIKYFQKFY